MRAPVYTKDKQHRIVSRPAEQWACQEYRPKTDKQGYALRSPQHDPWHDTHRATARGEAYRQLSAYGPIDD